MRLSARALAAVLIWAVAVGCSAPAEPTPTTISFKTPAPPIVVPMLAMGEPASIEEGPPWDPIQEPDDEVSRAEAYYSLPYGLLNAIAILESSGGLHACGFNEWGYASCAVTFSSRSEGIWTVAATLAAYGGDTRWKLCVWNAGAQGCREGRADRYVAQGLALMP